MLGKRAGHGVPQFFLFLHNQPCPDANPERPLKLLGQVVPAVVVTGRVRGEVVLDRMGTPCAVGAHMVGVPRGVKQSSADMTSPVGLRRND